MTLFSLYCCSAERAEVDTCSRQRLYSSTAKHISIEHALKHLHRCSALLLHYEIVPFLVHTRFSAYSNSTAVIQLLSSFSRSLLTLPILGGKLLNYLLRLKIAHRSQAVWLCLAEILAQLTNTRYLLLRHRHCGIGSGLGCGRGRCCYGAVAISAIVDSRWTHRCEWRVAIGTVALVPVRCAGQQDCLRCDAVHSALEQIVCHILMRLMHVLWHQFQLFLKIAKGCCFFHLCANRYSAFAILHSSTEDSNAISCLYNLLATSLLVIPNVSFFLGFLV